MEAAEPGPLRGSLSAVRGALLGAPPLAAVMPYRHLEMALGLCGGWRGPQSAARGHHRATPASARRSAPARLAADRILGTYDAARTDRPCGAWDGPWPGVRGRLPCVR